MISKNKYNRNIDLFLEKIEGEWRYECTVFKEVFDDDSNIRFGTITLSPKKRNFCLSVQASSKRIEYLKKDDKELKKYKPPIPWYSGPDRSGYIESDVLTIPFYSKIDKFEGEITIPLTTGEINETLEGEFTFRKYFEQEPIELEGVIVLKKVQSN